MGWTYIRGFSRDDIVQERLRTSSNEWGTWKVLANELVRDECGYILWKVMEKTSHKDCEYSGAKAGDVERYIACDLIEKHDGDWGYKDLTEVMHPTCVGCPLEFLDMTPCENKDWRAQVRAWHIAKRTGQKFDDVLASVRAQGELFAA